MAVSKAVVARGTESSDGLSSERIPSPTEVDIARWGKWNNWKAVIQDVLIFTLYGGTVHCRVLI